ncbi:fad binding domain-containing protein [Rutstroemia sp. NJR-2017a WRK4]|nr:fad binding domain-containing protein [Rutstroemia sp. NJR-2017a WRK4]
MISYLGKSTGAGALSVWTHYLKDIDFLDWSDQYYNSKAVMVGAGVQAYELLAASTAKGLVTVRGECATVGIAGGYTQGGHSALSSNFGLSADNVLSWKVVNTDGSIIITSRSKNADLYWVLSRGGGGTYGVVVSMTVKAHQDTTVGGASLLFLSSGTALDNFYSAIDKFHTLLPTMVNAGSMVVYYFTNTFFQISPITVYNKTATETKSILSCFIDALTTLNITYTSSFTTSTMYEEHYNTYFGPLPYGNINIGIAQYGDRLISRDNVANNLPALSMAYRNITENGVTFIGIGLNVSSSIITSRVFNSVLPAWRNALNFTAPWDDMLALQDDMTYSIIPQLEAATPNSGAYLNEGNFRQIGWKQDFYGINYGKLLSIKNKYDPNHMFYAVTAIGSDVWTVGEDGRMCRA